MISSCIARISGGGGIYAGNVNLLRIISSSLRDNSAEGVNAGRGGGVLFDCDNLESNYTCSTDFQDNIFTNNRAEVEGGGIATLIASISDLEGCTFQNNTSAYGGDITNSLTSIVANKPLLNANYTHLGDILLTLASGQPMTDPIYIYLQDQEGNIITSDSSSTLLFTAVDQSTSMTGNLITAKNGNFSLHPLLAVDAPNKLISIYIYIYCRYIIYIYYIVLNGEFSIKNVQSQILAKLPSTVTLNITLRNCRKGEVQIENE